MGIFAWIVVGLIAGWRAGKMVGGRGFGVLGNMVVGATGTRLDQRNVIRHFTAALDRVGLP